MAEKVDLQQKIQAYRQSNPKLKKLSDNQVLSIMVKNGVITLTAEQKQSIFASSKQKDNNTGLQVEKTTKANSKKTIYLQSGRKVVYSRLADGRTVMQYFGADGTPIKPDYFKKVEGQISIAANGSSYTVTKNGKKRTLKAKNPTQGAVDQNLAKLNNEEKRLNKTKKEQGWIGKGWDWVKNKTGIGDGSDEAQQQINAERKLLNQVKTGKISKKDFKNATGVDYSKENLEKFKRGELSQATAKIDGYKEGQEMASDVTGDMISGIAAVGIYTAAVAAAPFTGGASIAVGVAAATASGALIKAGVKALDTVGTDKKYTMKDFGHDLATGAFSGALAPITGGLGGAVGKTVATKLGIQAVKQVGKEVAEEVVETGVKQGLKTALTNPAGYEYVGGTLLKRGTAMAAEMATDGALGGAIDGGFRAGLDNNWDTEAMLDGAVEGGVGGALASPLIGGGFKVAGKGAQKVFGKDNVKIDANGNKVADKIPSKIENKTPRAEKDVDIEPESSKKSITQEEQEIPTKKAANLETPIQIQERLIKELENVKSREDFSRITQEMKNLPKTEEYQAVRQRLGGEYFQRYNEWKANLPESTRAIKNMADDVNPKNVSNVLIKKEDIIAKYCSENGLVTDDILSIFNKCTKDLDDASVERLLELASENKINLFSSQKEKLFLSFKRHCNEHSLSVNPKGILNYLKEGDEETAQFLKELLTLEKQGKIKPKNINEMLKLYTYDDDFNSFTEQSKFLAQKLQSGEILDAQIRDAIFFIENEMPLEIINPKNISKYAKDDLRVWSLMIQDANCKGLATETFNAINRELASLVKINKVPVNVSQKFSSQFNSTMNILGNNNFSIEKLAKAGGIKLQYSRNSFKSDIFNEIKHLSPIEQEKILSKFGLSKNSENILSGLPVEISPNGLNDIEKAINNHIHKFLSKENKIVLPKGFEELHSVIESICNAIPEFRFTIQAQQHNAQKYNLAEHMLKAFQENMKNPMYKELSETDKRILGVATLLHDINKIERTKFDQHALPSSQTVNAIVERIPNLTPMEKNRIVNLVKYHHWLTDISDKENPTLVKKLTEVFRSGNDFKLARIFAESDLKAVNDSFYTNYGEKLNYSIINEIEEAILALQSKSRMMFTASVNTEKALEKGAKLTTIGEGREATSNIVIDANQMGLDKEFFAYHGATEKGLMTVFASGGYDKGLGLSISTGKNGVCKVFQDYEVFAIFDKLDMNAIGKVSDGNANTKYGKDINRILRYMGSDSKFVTKFREYYPHQISDREYALVFREIQGLELSEVSKNKNIIKILGDTNKALDFEKALECANQFFASSVEDHNELVAFDLYPTAVGIKCKLENLSFEFRKFLQDNNIVIINNIK